MDKPSNMHECSNTKSWDEGNIRRFEWRLDLVYRYKLYFDFGAHFSREQMDFINGFLHPMKMMAIACRYHLAIIDATEIASAEEQRMRKERLAAAAANYASKG